MSEIRVPTYQMLLPGYEAAIGRSPGLFVRWRSPKGREIVMRQPLPTEFVEAMGKDPAMAWDWLLHQEEDFKEFGFEHWEAEAEVREREHQRWMALSPEEREREWAKYEER